MILSKEEDKFKSLKYNLRGAHVYHGGPCGGGGARAARGARGGAGAAAAARSAARTPPSRRRRRRTPCHGSAAVIHRLVVTDNGFGGITVTYFR